jgi:glycosyltransferase involved in cell wall biosynthesis
MKISIISPNLSNNCLGRAYLLAKVLRRHYKVDIHGFTFSSSNEVIWTPCNTGEFNYKARKGGSFPFFLKSMREMLSDIDGDVIYASKPLLPSYGIALLKKRSSGRPVILDIDDLETSWFNHLRGLRRWLTFLDPSGPIYTKWLEKQIRTADEITTVSAQLQKIYGRGVLIPHGKDMETFNPARYDRERLRQEFNFDNFKIIMFLGTIRPHKGLDHIAEALNMIGSDDIRLVIIGAGSEPKYEKRLVKLGRGRIILKDKIPFVDIPRYLHAADLVVLSQKKTERSLGQIPAKIFDAMAMAKPIISTAVTDIPKILEGCGIVVEPENITELAEKITWVFANYPEAEKMGQRAREKCIVEYSWDVMEKRLVGIFEKYR